MKKLALSVLLVMLAGMPGFAMTIAMDCISDANGGEEAVCSQVDADGNWLLAIHKEDSLGTITLGPREQEQFLKLHKRAEMVSAETLKQGQPLLGVPVGEIRRLSGYEGMTLMTLLLDVHGKTEDDLRYRLSIHSTGHGAAVHTALLDSEGLNRLFLSGEKVEEQAVALKAAEERLESLPN